MRLSDSALRRSRCTHGLLGDDGGKPRLAEIKADLADHGAGFHGADAHEPAVVELDHDPHAARLDEEEFVGRIALQHEIVVLADLLPLEVVEQRRGVGFATGESR